jgi:FMN phosphatase YigB (HAD superfamily)
LYVVADEPELNPFADDVGETLRALSDAGVRIGVLSDIHIDLRPRFAAHRLPDGRLWSDLVEVWLLSFETGLVKPDPSVFALALTRLELPAQDVLMVGDRGSWDGGAADAGITTLLLPSLEVAGQRRLHHVLRLALPGVGHAAEATSGLDFSPG